MDYPIDYTDPDSPVYDLTFDWSRAERELQLGHIVERPLGDPAFARSLRPTDPIPPLVADLTADDWSVVYDENYTA